MRPMMMPNNASAGSAPPSSSSITAPLDWSRTPMAAAFMQSGGNGLSNLARAFDPSQFNGSFGQYLQSFRQAPPAAPAPAPMPPQMPPQGMPPQGMPPQGMPPQGGPPPGMGWRRPDFPGQGHAWGRGFDGGAKSNPAFNAWRAQRQQPGRGYAG